MTPGSIQFFPRPSTSGFSRRVIATSLLILLGLSVPGKAATYTVTTADDTGAAGSLRWAIEQANANPGSTIILQNHLGTIGYSSPMPVITTSMTIQGGTGNTISGQSQTRLFFIDTQNATDQVLIANVSLTHGIAIGGSGGLGGGGGGLGAGGAIFVNSGALTVQNVAFANNSAVGGAGGFGGSAHGPSGGGGGGLGGNGGNGLGLSGAGGGGFGGSGGSTYDSSSTGGGGGLIGHGGDGTVSWSEGVGGGGGGGLTNGSSSSAESGGAGGVGGGKGGDVQIEPGISNPAGQDGSLYGGGGGAGLTIDGSPTHGGNGGKYGGGGGGSAITYGVTGEGTNAGHGGDFGGGGGAGYVGAGINNHAGSGGFGGGGGGGAMPAFGFSGLSQGGAGGFGGGGGGGYENATSGGYLGGSTAHVIADGSLVGIAGGGGGGAAGGHIFVRAETGGSLTIIGGSMDAGAVTGGQGGEGGPHGITPSQSGTGAGSALFLHGGTTTISVGLGENYLVAGSIADASADGYAAARLVKTGAGALTLTGNQTYAGPTEIHEGSFRLEAGSLASSSVHLVSTAFHLVNNTTVSGNITGSGTLARGGSGASVLTGTVAGTIATHVESGTLQIGNGGTTGEIEGAIANDGTLVFHRSNASTHSGVISGGGEVVKRGVGVLTLTAANTYSGGTTIEAGKLVAAHSGEVGTFRAGSTVTVNASGTLQVNASDSLGWGNGNARLVVNGGTVTTDGTAGQHTTLQNVAMTSGRLTDAGGNGQYFLNGELVTHASATSAVIDARRLELGSGWIPGSTAFTVADGAAAIDLDIASEIMGAGTLFKKGAGLLRLTGSNSYSGSTVVLGGSLVVEGSISGSVIVEYGASLGGSGRIGGGVMLLGGTLSPGNSPGKLTLLGNLNMDDGAVLLLEFSGLEAFDQLDVQGDFDAGGTLHLRLVDGYVPNSGDSFQIFTGLTPDYGGDFAIESNLGDGLFWDTSALRSDGIISVVPEPSAGALVVGAAAVFLASARRRLVRKADAASLIA